MDPEVIDKARQVVSNLLGETFAAKASSPFCLAFGQPTSRFFAAALEGAPGLLQNQSIVIEFAASQLGMIEDQYAMERLRETAAWTSLGKAIRKTIEDAQVSGEHTLLRPAHLLRQAQITGARNDFYRTAGAVRNEIERLGSGFLRPGSEIAAWLQFPCSVTEVCWLNRSLRTYVSPRVLADVVADKNIERIDLPRKLQLDINTTGGTVGAVEFRSRFSRSGKGVIVAIIDQEVPLKHHSLENRVFQKANFSGEPWGTPGTHGAALAGIVGSNHDVFTGMAPEALIYNYKVEATNPIVFGDDINGALGIEQALEDGADVANCSWGTQPASDGTSREARACNEAWRCGLVVVKSAGNGGPGPGTLTTPADADGVIVVGATDREGNHVQNYSSRGPAGTKNRPHLVAPGGTVVQGVNSCEPGGGFGDCGNGTSFAAAHVSGILALILQDEQDLTPDQLRAKLVGLCRPFAGVDVNTQGAGLLSLDGLV